MAINLTVALTDSEQAKVQELAAVVAPGMSAAQLKAWAEAKAKSLLREHIVDLARRERLEAENVARRDADAAFVVAWAEPVVEEPAPE